VDKFLYIGGANKRLYQKFGVSQELLYSAPYAVDNKRFVKQATEYRSRRSELRRFWAIDDDAYCVLFCGKLIPKKRPMDLVKAAQILRANGGLTNIHLLFVGSGELDFKLREACNVVHDAERQQSPYYSQLIGSSNLPPATFAGFLNQTQISRAYVAADCLVLPSDYGETWGLVVNEALASGLPCLVSDACGCAEDLIDDKFRFAMGDARAISQKLEQISKASQSETLQPPASIDESIDSIAQAYSNIGK
jgi:glycosyltransferase involved in cell wall biosynthesis